MCVQYHQTIPNEHVVFQGTNSYIPISGCSMCNRYLSLPVMWSITVAQISFDPYLSQLGGADRQYPIAGEQLTIGFFISTSFGLSTTERYAHLSQLGTIPIFIIATDCSTNNLAQHLQGDTNASSLHLFCSSLLTSTSSFQGWFCAQITLNSNSIRMFISLRVFIVVDYSTHNLHVLSCPQMAQNHGTPLGSHVEF